MNPFIVFEGVDGVGKTTLAHALASRVDGKYFYSPPSEFDKLRAKVHALEKDLPPELFYELKLHFYMAGNIFASTHIEELLDAYPLIGDRYVYSTIANLSVQLERPIQIPAVIKMPDKIVYVHADWDVIEQRLRAREERKSHENIPLMVKVDAMYRSIIGEDAVYVDTSNISVTDTVDRILSELQEFF